MHNGFDNNYFDKILTLGFLHHLDDSSVSSVLKEVKRILKPNGTLLLIEDAPIISKFNIIGKVILRNDIGSNIRTGPEYKAVLEKCFIVNNYYEVKSGFYIYSVFVLSQSQ
jgi:SAM-dependent methyltransferase